MLQKSPSVQVSCQCACLWFLMGLQTNVGSNCSCQLAHREVPGQQWNLSNLWSPWPTIWLCQVASWMNSVCQVLGNQLTLRSGVHVDPSRLSGKSCQTSRLQQRKNFSIVKWGPRQLVRLYVRCGVLRLNDDSMGQQTKQKVLYTNLTPSSFQDSLERALSGLLMEEYPSPALQTQSKPDGTPETWIYSGARLGLPLLFMSGKIASINRVIVSNELRTQGGFYVRLKRTVSQYNIGLYVFIH